MCLELGSSGKKVMLRPEQSPVNRIMDVVLRCCKAEEIVVYACPGMLAIAKVCLRLPHHCYLVRCERDSMCLVVSLPALMEVFSRHALIW